MIHYDLDKSHFLSKCYLFKTVRNDGYTAGSALGFPNPCFGYIISGSSIFTASDRTIELFPGDLVFIPKGQIYTSVWTADPLLKFYSLNFEFVSEKATRFMYEFSKIHDFGLLPLFDELYEAISNDCPKDFVGQSKFYEILSAVDGKFAKAVMPRESEIRAAVEYIEKNSNVDISVPFLSKLCCMSESKFYTLFKRTVGYTPTDYKNLIKVRKAEAMIVQGQLTLEEICDRCGFSSPSYLRRVYRRFTGKTPKETRRSTVII